MADNIKIEEIEAYVIEFTDLMSVDAIISVELADSDDGKQKVISIDYEGEDLGYMIGNRGSHLRGLQYILSMLVNNKFAPEGERYYVNVDVSGYKKQRFDRIEQISLRMAEDARQLGQPVDMEPMSAAERRVAHMTLSTFEDISTESFGEGPQRHVRITPKVKKEASMEMFEDEVAIELLGDDDEN